MSKHSRDTTINNPLKVRKPGRVSIEVKSEPIRHNFDEVALGKGPAEAIRALVESQIRSISKVVAKSTLAKRRAKGITSSRLYNATGKLAKGLSVALVGKEYQTRAPRDRLTGETAELVPELLDVAEIDARELVKDRRVQDAIRASWAKMVSKGR